MQIKSFSVENFRSITKARDLPIHDLSILVGPNNEGKSNILQGLVMTLKYVEESILERKRRLYRQRYYSRGRSHRRYRVPRLNYDWSRDFPLKLQESKPNGQSKFEVEFQLNAQERKNLRKSIKTKIFGDLKIAVSMGKRGIEEFKARDTSNLRKKLPYFRVLNFLSKRISIQYINAIRSSETTEGVVRNMIEEELGRLREKKEYKKLRIKMIGMEKPVFQKLSKSVTRSVSSFLPDVKNVEFGASGSISSSLDISNIIVDDGTRTELELKGDGIKSLFAISIIEYVAKQKALKKNMILAIEEPESHLHPMAIHGIQKVLENISKSNQVVITTHSPILVNRSDVKNNLLVSRTGVEAATSISEIRRVLGVQVSDNMINSDLVVIVEGETDGKILGTWLRSFSEKIKDCLNSGFVIFDNMAGAANLPYKLSQWKSWLCSPVVFLDNDVEGITNHERVKNENLIAESEVFHANVRGFRESEIEDLIKKDVYKEAIKQKFGVDLIGNTFRNNRKKWSDRLKDTFREQGRIWNAKVKAEAKSIVADRVINSERSLEKSCFPLVEAITKKIEDHIERNKR